MSLWKTIIAQLYGYRSSDATFQPARLDKATNTLQIIDYEHHELHGGSAFTCHFSNDCTNTGEMTMIAFKTPDTEKWLHCLLTAESTAGAYVAIYEDADLDLDEGTDLTIWNRDRNSATASTVLTIETSPDTGKATSYTEAQAAGATLATTKELMRHYMGAATVGADYAGASRAVAEFILKRNTVYAFVIVSTSDDNNTHNLSLDWYEHTNIA